MGCLSRDVLEPERHVYLNDIVRNRERCAEYRASLTNVISTSKYTAVTFVPQNLFEQFQLSANIYFLILSILQSISIISSLNPLTSAMPLIFVVLFSMAKAGIDDWKRHKSDREINNKPTLVLEGSSWVQKPWEQVVVGDFVRVENNAPVPADIVLLSTTDSKGECFIETADLDGETNLKIRRACDATSNMFTPEDLTALKAEVNCEPPNNRLSRFVGKLAMNGEKFSLDNNNLILRGCTVRNTEAAHGVVVFAGADTKLMQNTGKVRFKRTSLDLMLNKFILGIFLLLAVLCIICAILSAHWERTTGDDFLIYLPRPDVENPDAIGALTFFSFVIILQTLVPISLYISVEIIRLGLSKLIEADVDMYDEESNTPAVARSTSLNEDLGQIDYIFSDKTGTLTQNRMNMLKCTVGGVIYGKDPVEGEPYSGFINDTLQEALDKRQEDVMDFFRLLALCHTVRAEEKNGKVEYQAESPDEKALVDGARMAGFEFVERSEGFMHIKVNGEAEAYQLLNILEFNSTRKRMSILLRRKDGGVRVYCKGADNIMLARLSAESASRDKATVNDHLSVYSRDGLRTLVLAQKDLTPEEYDEWSARYREAETSLDEREEKVEVLADEMEQNLNLVGVTAIEDKLQDRVPTAIHNLISAGIKVWVLTGDKQETAINIGMSCRLLSAEMDPLLIVDGHDLETVAGQIKTHLNTVQADPNGRPYGLVVNGHSLVFPLPPTEKEIKTMIELDDNGESRDPPVLYWTEERLQAQNAMMLDFVELAKFCRSVVCCRVSPLQKAQVVTLIKKQNKARTLAIGDGANDVSMIKAAHIGVGISGLEGRQAVNSSDFSIAQFKFLEKLLLVHGKWSYLRMSKFLKYFLYKNSVNTLVGFFYAFFSAYSATTPYDEVFISLYNTAFTSLGIIVLALFEQDVDAETSLRYPVLYEAGLRHIHFSKLSFFLSIAQGFYQSIVVFFVGLLAARAGGMYNEDGLEQGDYLSLTAYFSLVVIFVVSIQLAIETTYWTWMNWFGTWIGPMTWLYMFGLMYNWDDWLALEWVSPYFGVFNRNVGSDAGRTYWGAFFLTIAIAVAPFYFLQFLRIQLRPTPIDIVREIIEEEKDKAKVERRLSSIKMHAMPKAEQPARHSSFDFSQSDNVGRDLFPARSPRLSGESFDEALQKDINRRSTKFARPTKHERELGVVRRGSSIEVDIDVAIGAKPSARASAGSAAGRASGASTPEYASAHSTPQQSPKLSPGTVPVSPV